MNSTPKSISMEQGPIQDDASTEQGEHSATVIGKKRRFELTSPTVVKNPNDWEISPDLAKYYLDSVKDHMTAEQVSEML